MVPRGCENERDDITLRYTFQVQTILRLTGLVQPFSCPIPRTHLFAGQYNPAPSSPQKTVSPYSLKICSAC